MKIAAVTRIAMEFIQRPQRRRLLSALPYRVLDTTANQRSFTSYRSDFRDKRRRPAVDLPARLDQPRKRL
jgi:hypothetical protein